MLVAGDEMGRTQGGNNNAYCQDNAISWLDWEHTDAELVAFVQRLIELRRSHPVFHRRHFFQGQSIHGAEIKDIHWLKPDGTDMSDHEWGHDFARCLGVYLSGEALTERDRRGHLLRDDNFLVLFNAHHDTLAFQLPAARPGGRWHVLLDTSHAQGLDADGYYAGYDSYPLTGRSLALLVDHDAPRITS